MSTLWLDLAALVVYGPLIVLLHEAGHVFGFLHSNDPTRLHTCGCGDAAVRCDAGDDRASIMHSVSMPRARACLGRDDVDGVRTVFGGDCAAPLVCQPLDVGSRGAARVGVAVAYGALAAAVAAALLTALERRAPA